MTITQDQSLQRWDALPMALRETMTSQTSSDFVWKTCSGEHLPEEKIYPVLKLVGYVLLGFIHPEDLSSELKNELNIDQRMADAITAALGNRIFAPLKNELDKIYGPPTSFATAMPKLMEEIKAPEPVIKPLAPATPPTPTTQSPAKEYFGEFEKLGKVAAPPSFTKPAEPGAEPHVASNVEPLPMIIHEEESASQLRAAPEFKISTPPAKAFSDFSSGKPAPPRPAVLELGEIPRPPAPKPTTEIRPPQGSDESPRVVHYGELKTLIERPISTERIEMTAPSANLGQIKSALPISQNTEQKPIPPRPTTPPAYTVPITPPATPTKEPLGEFEKMRAFQKQQPTQTIAAKPPTPQP